MAHAIMIHEQGGPEVMRYEEVSVGAPGPGEVRLRQTCVGLNYIDVYQRTGVYKFDLPTCIGMEAAGVVEAVGDGVEVVKVGDRVGYVMGTPGAYASERIYPAERLIPLPDDISDEQAAGSMLKGLTVSYLVRRTFPVQAGQTVLLHAAAGGVGTIACQWLKKLGATVIGTVGSDEKAEIARAHGCDHPIVYTREDFQARVMEITGGEGVPVVYDGVGAAVFEGSLGSLARFGTLVHFGAASGPAPAVDPKLLAPKALYFTRPGLAPHTATRALTLDIAEALFQKIREGVKIEINQSYDLKDAAEAHRALEARETTGSTIFRV
ncbi:MAG: quinone oxidoreductase [Nisaea sp.]|uniref:quinone oxidoreductase family protein n=1 Tax=Nisaea sp. TaxID=2024842 RepID=UPI001B10FCD0|nr:quinone oxidoreductase [Nisaea sp.]MBO6562514.1 quinone oxidoreductase [Nisaea sp.]